MIISNFDEIKRGHEHFLAGNERLLLECEERAGRHAVEYVQGHSSFKTRTGNLQEKTRYRLIKTAGGRILRITNSAPYAAAIDTGSKAHWIYPKQTTTGLWTTRGSVLAFMGRAGVMVFRRRVWHPGTKPYRFLYDATDSAYRVLGQDLAHGMTDLARRF